MNTLRIAAACAAALLASAAVADDTATTTPPAEPAAQDTGGVTPAMQTGTNPVITRDQVYQDLLRAQQSGQLQRLQRDLYNGG